MVGIFREWHENGRLARETSLLGGVAQGDVRAWARDGRGTGIHRITKGQEDRKPAQ